MPGSRSLTYTKPASAADRSPSADDDACLPLVLRDVGIAPAARRPRQCGDNIACIDPDVCALATADCAAGARAKSQAIITAQASRAAAMNHGAPGMCTGERSSTK